MQFINYVAVILLFLFGLYGILRHRNLLRIMLSLSVMENASYLLLIILGYRTRAAAPIFYGKDMVPGETPVVDPIMQALTLTSIVVGVVTLAMVLALIIQLAKHYGTLDASKIRDLRG